MKHPHKNKEVKMESGLPPKVDLVELETTAEKRARIRSLWIIYIESFIFQLGFSIVIAGLFPYLKQVPKPITL